MEARVQPPQLRQGEGGQRPGAVGAALQGGVVGHHHLAVAGEVHVQLQHVRVVALHRLAEGVRKMVNALKAAGGKPKFTEYPGVGHNSWDMAYGTRELWDWLLMQKK